VQNVMRAVLMCLLIAACGSAGAQTFTKHRWSKETGRPQLVEDQAPGGPLVLTLARAPFPSVAVDGTDLTEAEADDAASVPSGPTARASRASTAPKVSAKPSTRAATGKPATGKAAAGKGKAGVTARPAVAKPAPAKSQAQKSATTKRPAKSQAKPAAKAAGKPAGVR
jgi:hypothetical protein